MPSRKSEASESKTASRRSSLRRLSSLASLHTLNLFNRRRSNNNTGSSETPSLASNVSLTSTAATPHVQRKDHAFRGQGHIDPAPPPLTPTSQSGYICLPDDPIGGMPRSRTCSNLPLPARMKKSSRIGPLVPSKSHARLPPPSLPSTRLPSPHFSTRKHSVSRLTAIDNYTTVGRKKPLPRSDTEPLLRHPESRSSLPKTTAFKENIDLSPVRCMADSGLLHPEKPQGLHLPFHAHVSRLERSRSQDRHYPLLSSSNASSVASVFKHHELPSATHMRLPEKNEAASISESFARSSIYHRPHESPPVSDFAVQRWDQQSVGHDNYHSSKRYSYHGEIKQNRLMSAIQPPTPPPSKTSLGSESIVRAKLRSPNNSNHIRPVSGQSPVNEVAAQFSNTRPRYDALNAKPEVTINQAEPFTYWTGRFSSLNDKYRNEDLLASLNLPRTTSISTASLLTSTSAWRPKSETDKMHSVEANAIRIRRAVEYLYHQCGSDEARHSFLKWQKQLARLLDMPDLGDSINRNENGAARSCALAMTLKGDSERQNGGLDCGDSRMGAALSVGRKMTFMDRLLGKKGRAVLGAVA